MLLSLGSCERNRHKNGKNRGQGDLLVTLSAFKTGVFGEFWLWGRYIGRFWPQKIKLKKAKEKVAIVGLLRKKQTQKWLARWLCRFT